ncbi:MAG: BamA/TamA family outer membrane protein [Bacteroidales bacterium]|nr:BamA/TamA family outer membrane protein [Bacteroidales bacterium]
MFFSEYKKLLHFALIFLILYSCRTTRFVPENEWLLKKNSVKIDNSKISLSDLETYIQPKPNKKIFWIVPFHLYVYNLSNIGKERNWKKKIGSIVGEPPVLVNEYLIKRSKQQLSIYLKSKGYYYTQISDTIIKRKKKAIVEYRIKTGNPYTIQQISWNTNDPQLGIYLKEAVAQSLIKKNSILDEDILQQERMRITEYLKNKGYYYFTKDYIIYEVDTTVGNFKANITGKILPSQKQLANGTIIELPHQIFFIDSVFVFYNYNAKLATQNRQEYIATLDTTNYQNLYLIGTGKLAYKPSLINRMNFIQPNSIYSQKDAQVTYDKFMSLQNFKLINIQFNESGNTRKLNAFIQLSPLPRQTYQIEAEGTNSSGNLGIAGNLLYTNRNVFGGAQNLFIGINGSIERQTAVVQQNNEQIQEYLPFNAIESGVNARIRFPSFLFPFISDNFIKYNNPTTQMQAAYNFQQRPDYTRTVTTLTFGYEWSGNKNLKHFVNPIELNYVRIPFISWRFRRVIRGTFLENSYENHMETITSYGFIYNNNKVGRKKLNSVFLRSKFETSGNILFTFFKQWSDTNENGTYQILEVPYSQFIRADVDYRYYRFISKTSKLVYRFYGGAGFPYGNSEVLPFNKRYFSGGASSIRAWTVRSLGPGSLADTTQGNIFNQTGDIKLEGNLEYRFKLFWTIEPALFVDIGNIWNIRKKGPDNLGYFNINRFFYDLALGYGIGIRFNFGFFILRTDFALKGRDPSEPLHKQWLFVQRKLQQDDFNFNIGIGYPF